MAQPGTRLVIPAGVTVFGPVQIPVSVRSITVTLDRNSWPDRGTQTVLTLSIEVSEDNVVYERACSCTTTGGLRSKPTSQTVNFNPSIPIGTWVQAVTDAIEPLDTRAVITWQS